MALRTVWSIGIGTCILLTGSCTHFASPSEPVVDVVAEHPNLRLIRKDGSSINVYGATVARDSVIGSSSDVKDTTGTGLRVAVALSDIERTEIKEIDVARTTGLSVGFGLGVLGGVIVVLAAIFSQY